MPYRPVVGDVTGGTDLTPVETVSSSPWGVCLSGGTYLLAAVFGIVGAFTIGLGLRSLAGPTGALVATLALPIGFLAGAGGTVATVAGLVGGSRLVLGRTAFVYADPRPWRSDESVPYEAVDVVLRRRPLADRFLGTATYDVVCSGYEDTTVWYLRDPDAVERVFESRCRDPTEQVAAATRRNHRFWHLWPDDVTPPDGVVNDRDDVEELLDADLSGVDFDELDEAIDADGFEDLSDVGDVDVGGGFDGGGDVGGGFDGGGDGGGGGE
jgi:uncharacterized membrane protein YgcG